ncbi:unnamed protein product, partial [Ixodes pacificus]
MHLPVLLKLLNIISKHLSVVPVGSQYSTLLGNQMLRFLNRTSLWSLIRHLQLLAWNLGPPWILAYLLWSRVILLLQSLLGHSHPSRPTQSSIRRGRAHRSDLGPAPHQV